MEIFVGVFFGSLTRLVMTFMAPLALSVIWLLYYTAQGRTGLAKRVVRFILLWLAACLCLLLADILLFMMALGAHRENLLLEGIIILAAATSVVTYLALLPGIFFLARRHARTESDA